MPNLATFSERLKYARNLRAMRQAALALHLGYKRYSAIARYESGERMPAAGVLTKISDCLGVSAEWLLSGTVDARACMDIAQARQMYSGGVDEMAEHVGLPVKFFKAIFDQEISPSPKLVEMFAPAARKKESVETETDARVVMLQKMLEESQLERGKLIAKVERLTSENHALKRKVADT